MCFYSFTNCSSFAWCYFCLFHKYDIYCLSVCPGRWISLFVLLSSFILSEEFKLIWNDDRFVQRPKLFEESLWFVVLVYLDQIVQTLLEFWLCFWLIWHISTASMTTVKKCSQVLHHIIWWNFPYFVWGHAACENPVSLSGLATPFSCLHHTSAYLRKGKWHKNANITWKFPLKICELKLEQFWSGPTQSLVSFSLQPSSNHPSCNQLKHTLYHNTIHLWSF